MTAPRERKGSQPEYEIYEYAKELDYHDPMVVIGIRNGKKIGLEGEGSYCKKPNCCEHEDESDEQSGYEGMYEEDEDDEEVVEEAINVEDKGDEEAINEEVEDDEEAENDKMAENKNEDSEEHEEDPEFYDRAYE
ncbi:acidic leucine-rich nuclear phosphoprotein 32 family member A-like [Prunus yedoensis var. nudiflora]|uniref:Acidic leucine-rich nuclear phosphoprotein 32 family member A-like n=1 Tax=Prunus yedoensis var. nudiflora TaxID=2094558 RepID=A0A314XUD4_PRUYE|nr:acidic leucine-rich nuclear phosphoprotein 32 family member A-like [Prunus yedoensis var. nudiflora]